MNMKQSCKALICAIEGELDGRHCTEEQAAAILDHALPSLTEALALAEAERDRYKLAWMEFMDRTDWMQEKGQVPAKYLGQHRADVLTAILNEARAALATQPAAGEPEQQAAINSDDLPTKKYPLGAFDFDSISTAAAPVAAGEPVWSCVDDWFLSLEPGRQAVLRDDKWMLAGAAFNAGRQCAAPPAAAHGDEAARKDAERYRWLRNPGQDVALVLDKKTGHVPVDERGFGGYGIYEYRAGAELDEAIDAAMRAQAGEGGE